MIIRVGADQARDAAWFETPMPAVFGVSGEDAKSLSVAVKWHFYWQWVFDLHRGDDRSGFAGRLCGGTRSRRLVAQSITKTNPNAPAEVTFSSTVVYEPTPKEW